ncbi:MAG: FAD-dependent oxidoreductase [Gemmatimonadota bacterium]|nr:FAD-dependent oxidoreductase [Gemmatimonadota bacterium]
MPDTPDFLVIGGGIVGLTVARELRRRHPGSRIVLLEKEDRPGEHASGRNSGVLHAGFYYTADSLKARFSRDGNRELTEWCLERGLRIRRCGKLVVTRSEAELPALEELFRRAGANGVEVERVDEDGARRLEPLARTTGAALWSPTTSTVDPAEVVASLAADAADAGIEIRTGTAYAGRGGDEILTSRGRLTPGFTVNAAGLHADRVARDFGFSERYRILPFKGLYLYHESGPAAPAMHVYPVPRLDQPFLGVHWTATAAGRAKIGPTAIPALWRENYGGLSGFRPLELLEIGWREAGLWWRNEFGFRRLAVSELRKYAKRHLVSLALELLRPGLAPGRWSWGRPGIRAQLFDLRAGRLEMDFRHEGDDRSHHVLNAVSPAFTCAFPFARHVVDAIEGAP